MFSNRNQCARTGEASWPLALLVALVIPLATVSAAPRDREAPEIVVEPSESNDPARDVVVRARVHDVSGVGTVTVWARGERDSGFEGYPMRPTGAGEWTGRVPFWSTRGMSVAYFIEATDSLGNGPRRSGSPETPYLVHLDRRSTAVAEQVARFGWNWINWILLGCCALALVFMAFVVAGFRNRRPDQAELDFWCNLLSPLSDKTGVELSKRIERLCEEYHDHPTLGRVRVKREEALLWLGTIRRSEPERLQLMRRIHRERGARELGRASSARTATHRKVSQDMFWFQLLVPLLGLSRAETTAALRELSGRPHVHPTLGIITLDQKTLRERLQWAYRANSAEVRERWRAANIESAPAGGRTRGATESALHPADEVRAGKSVGASLAEMLVVMAILGLVVGAASLYLKPLEAPVVSSVHLVESLIKQTRAKSMSTTSSYRLRPFADEQLVVEYAASCSADAWTLDPRMDLDLPSGVTMSTTDWSVCFNSRGTASNNVVLILEHPDYNSQKLEILMGGAVRWNGG